MSITRLSGGLTPADGADPRTFPTIFNAAADAIEANGSAIASLTLGSLTDVDVVGVQPGQTIVWDDGTSEWKAGAAGARGGGDDQIFYENGTAVTTSYSISSGANAMTAGPVSIGTAATVTVPAGSEWTIV